MNPQSMDALKRANEVRIARAGFKRDVREGKTTVAELLLDTPPLLESTPVVDVLLQLRRFGPSRVSRLLKACSVAPSVTFGSLTDRQRLVLVQTIREHVAASERPVRRSGGGRPRVVEAAPPRPVVRPGFCGCGEKLARPVADGRCGFCVEEAEVDQRGMGRAA